MHWDPMTMDEFAACQLAEGLKVSLIDGVWWVEIRPFFFRPLFPFAELTPQAQRYPAMSFLGGYLHAVPAGVAANSTMNFFVYDDLKSYSVSSLSSKRRKAIANGMKNFTAKILTNESDFVESAYDVYLSFQRRTNYSYKEERVNRQEFAEWAKSLFARPKVAKVGVYHEGKLCAIETSYLIEDVIVGDTLFANDLALKLDVTDFIYHIMREAAAKTDARYVFVGFPTGIESLDNSKYIRGCKLLTRPACYKINPVTLSVVRLFMKSSYEKLLKIMAPPAQPITIETERNTPAPENAEPSLQQETRLIGAADGAEAEAANKKAPAVHRREPLPPSENVPAEIAATERTQDEAGTR